MPLPHRRTRGTNLAATLQALSPFLAFLPQIYGWNRLVLRGSLQAPCQPTCMCSSGGNIPNLGPQAQCLPLLALPAPRPHLGLTEGHQLPHTASKVYIQVYPWMSTPHSQIRDPSDCQLIPACLCPLHPCLPSSSRNPRGSLQICPHILSPLPHKSIRSAPPYFL